jgi:hypothetical protein
MEQTEKEGQLGSRKGYVANKEQEEKKLAEGRQQSPNYKHIITDKLQNSYISRSLAYLLIDLTVYNLEYLGLSLYSTLFNQTGQTG